MEELGNLIYGNAKSTLSVSSFSPAPTSEWESQCHVQVYVSLIRGKTFAAWFGLNLIKQTGGDKWQLSKLKKLCSSFGGQVQDLTVLICNQFGAGMDLELSPEATELSWDMVLILHGEFSKLLGTRCPFFKLFDGKQTSTVVAALVTLVGQVAAFWDWPHLTRRPCSLVPIWFVWASALRCPPLSYQGATRGVKTVNQSVDSCQWNISYICF